MRVWSRGVGVVKCVSLLLAVSCACIASTSGEREACAQPRTEKNPNDQRARELFVKGDAAYAEGRYEEALAAFQESYELSGRALLLLSITNAYERLGRYAEAAASLEKYLASGKVKDRDTAQKRLANLKKRVEDQERDVKQEEERRRREEEERRRREQGGPPPPPPPPPEKTTPILPWALIGGGGVVLTTGVVFGVLALGARSDAKAGCTDASAGHLCDAGARSALDKEKTFGIVADVGIIAGLVLGGVGAWFLLRPESSTSPRVQVNAQRAGAGVNVVGAF
jgi:tetratricopeptide (TPR) repeat protein